MTDILKQTDMTEDQQACVDTIESSGQMLMALINDILDLSKLEAGKLTLEHIPFHIRRVLADLRGAFGHQAVIKGLEFHADLEADVPDDVMGDPMRFKQVLNNLVSNAIRFTQTGSVKVRVRTAISGEVHPLSPASLGYACRSFASPAPKRRQLSSAASGPATYVDVETTTTDMEQPVALLTIEVTDSGIGISQNVLDKLFGSFTQADSSTSRRFGGTGLGLHISQALVQLMLGDMGVSTKEGHGSTFWFRVPLQAAPKNTMSSNVTDTPPPSLLTAKGRAVTVMVAEDNPVTGTIMKRQLRSMGANVILAANGQEAFDYFKAKGDKHTHHSYGPTHAGDGWSARGKMYQKRGTGSPETAHPNICFYG